MVGAGAVSHVDVDITETTFDVIAHTILAGCTTSAAWRWDDRHAPEPMRRVTLRPRGGMSLHVTALEN